LICWRAFLLVFPPLCAALVVLHSSLEEARIERGDGDFVYPDVSGFAGRYDKHDEDGIVLGRDSRGNFCDQTVGAMWKIFRTWF
jgi:hypothetical protein